jgi:hypothetical protein
LVSYTVTDDFSIAHLSQIVTVSSDSVLAIHYCNSCSLVYALEMQEIVIYLMQTEQIGSWINLSAVSNDVRYINDSHFDDFIIVSYTENERIHQRKYQNWQIPYFFFTECPKSPDFFDQSHRCR